MVKILYITSHKSPYLINPVRGLSKVVTGSTEHSYKQMILLIKYLSQKSVYGIILHPKNKPT